MLGAWDFLRPFIFLALSTQLQIQGAASHGFERHYRNHCLDLYNNGAALPRSKSSIKRWRYYRMTGNKHTHKIYGHDQFLFLFYRTLCQCGPWRLPMKSELLFFGVLETPKIQSRSDISKAEKRWGLSKKKTSTSAFQALAQANVDKHWHLVRCLCELKGANRWTIVDSDELMVIRSILYTYYYSMALVLSIRD